MTNEIKAMIVAYENALARAQAREKEAEQYSFDLGYIKGQIFEIKWALSCLNRLIEK